MTVAAHSFLSTSASSLETGRETARRITDGLGRVPHAVLTYLTVNHDQGAFLRGMREVLGRDVPIVGCSAQGVVGEGSVCEEGYGSGAMALAGEGLGFAAAAVENIAKNPLESGRELGRAFRAQLSSQPKVVVLHYDALCGVDPDRFLEGLFREVECPILGGAAAHTFSYQSLRETYVYSDERVLVGAAAGVALTGDFGMEIGGCHGCAPVGVELEVTAAEGNELLRLDDQRASDVWAEICGDVDAESNQSAALAIGVRRGQGNDDYLVRAAYAINPKTGGVVIGPTLPVGTRIMLHHRTAEDVLDGARAMGESLARRLGQRKARAVLGYECGARTRPFLGDEATLAENVELQRKLAADAWLGMMPWGELLPVAGKPAFHNYSYPLLVLTD